MLVSLSLMEKKGWQWCLSRYLRQDGDAEGLAGVGGPQVDGQLWEKPPGRLSLHPACKLAAIPETWGKVLDLNQKRNKGENIQRETETEGQYSTKNTLYCSLSFSPLGINLQGCGHINWKRCFQVQINLECCLCAVTKRCKVEWGEINKSIDAHTHRKTPDSSSQSYYVLERWVCAILPWQHVSSPSEERQQLTRELRVMASTTALKTLTGRRSSVVPLSTIALSMLYWKRREKEWSAVVCLLSSSGCYGAN